MLGLLLCYYQKVTVENIIQNYLIDFRILCCLVVAVPHQ